MCHVFFSSPSLLRQLLFLTVLTFHIWYRLQSCYLFCLLCCGISTSEHHVKLKDWKLFVSLILSKYFSCLINIMRGKEYTVFSLYIGLSVHFHCSSMVEQFISKNSICFQNPLSQDPLKYIKKKLVLNLFVQQVTENFLCLD